MIIYKAENKINGHAYIGKSMRTLNKRKTEHLQYAKKRETNIYFYNALKKHGEENFEWSVLCETDSKEKLEVLERFYIACYRKMTKLYNQKDGGDGGSYKGRPVSLERKQMNGKCI